jgi:hypothetical protein
MAIVAAHAHRMHGQSELVNVVAVYEGVVLTLPLVKIEPGGRGRGGGFRQEVVSKALGNKSDEAMR